MLHNPCKSLLATAISMTVDLYGNLKAADIGTVSPYQF